MAVYGEVCSRRAAGALMVGFAGLVLVAVPGGGGSGAMLSLLAALPWRAPHWQPAAVFRRNERGMVPRLGTAYQRVCGG